ncbi:phosphomannomutase/phosphoglucomutase [Larsenimonas suaedae]|uniref:phosphomannomutase n=1 Tax=Larsenimonas suaedae TaxID=1851019 RepID=A0ABU1GY90_9GAMM|nr:phosphomannomutase/phosphoglucomutase [Larsenimonas suaedae]MCM2973104.1 phosphomannomutase/phosphoglucomutase [Larsenimonas suaedae]MDR5896541.1 phosphomannomutase/phosphoglucomutase [Larsenimonas suaedae]
MNDAFASIFRAYDIRGIVDEALTIDGARLIGKAIGSEAIHRGEHRLAVARDGRVSGPDMTDALIDGLISTGIDVIDIGMVPTPVLYFATHHLMQCQSGVAVTASHNPSNYNGFKIVLNGEALSNEAITRLHERIVQGAFAKGHGQRIAHDLSPIYTQRILDDVHLERPLKAVVDCGNGVGGELGPSILAALGVEVVPMYETIDGTFPNHAPDPGKLENLSDLVERVRLEGADLGIAFDGDADRIGVVTPSGEIIYPDRLLMALAEDLLSRTPGAGVVFDIKCTSNLARIVSEAGGDPEMWYTGHSLIKARMRETGALLGGEMSGHVFFKERWYGFDDGIYAAARVLELLSRQPEDADAFFARYPQDLCTSELNVSVTDAEKFALVERFATTTDFGPDATKTLLDGIRVDYPDGWGLCRASNTTPALVFRFEGKSQAALARIQDCFRAALTVTAPHAVPTF